MKEKLVTCTDPKFREIEPLLKEGWRIKDVKFASDSGFEGFPGKLEGNGESVSRIILLEGRR